ncbi:Ppx/GppA family phosphatase [Rhodobacteraceae bacterium NNCM2]|nr:Ppx/GppA family phosphatase [Coraliihabitans acroporae]
MAGPNRQGDFFGDQPPSFAPATGQLGVSRIGVVDVGSNSVRMVVFEGHCRSPAILFNEKVMCGLGASLQTTGKLEPEGKLRAIGALKRFAALAPGLHVGALSGVATAAIRDAADGSAFRDQIESETGIRLNVVSGADEARLAAQGVLFGNPQSDGVVIDLGGGSLEFARIVKGQVAGGVSTPLGPLRLQALLARSEPAFNKEIDRHFDKLDDQFTLDNGMLYLVGGSWRALAKVQMVRTSYPIEVIHEFRMSRDEALDLCEFAAKSEVEDLMTMQGVSSSRVAYIPLAARLLRRVIEKVNPGALQFSGFGLREGVCLENLPDSIRTQDPLISACHEQEARRSRAPGFGDELADWVVTAMPPASGREARLMRAAARLADVNWRTHPDFRADGCWETVTRTSITDVGHDGRVWLGAALVSRYKTRARRELEMLPKVALLAEGELDRAERVGLILRLGITLSAAAPGVLPHASLEIAEDQVILELDDAIRSHTGEEVEKRLGQLARAMDLDWELRFRK